ncbi:MAG: PQQ-binding-like beta-propeller repeat protein [Anaerolineales bacterium]|nr:PQQ-binding-like beta-propeller repeat protein [Anaerolineales bacterium]
MPYTNRLSILGLSIILCSMMAACSGSMNAARYAQQADQFASQGSFAEAVLTYRQALIADPDNPDLLFKLGKTLAAQGRNRSAAQTLNRAASIRPADKSIQKTLDTLESEPQDGLSLELAWISSLVEAEPIGAAVSSETVFIVYPGGRLLALDLEAGKVLWNFSARVEFISPPAADAQQVWVGTEDGALIIFDARSGETLGAFNTNGPVYAPPALTSTTAFCPSNDGWLYAVNRVSLKQEWRSETGDSLHLSPLVRGNNVYVGSNDGRVYAFDINSGERTWAYGILTQGAVESVPVFAEDRILVGSGDGRIYALEAGSGGEFWRFSTPDAVYASPIPFKEQVLVASSGLVLASVGLTDGIEKWRLAVDNPITETPAVFKNQLFLIMRSSPYLYAVDPATGEQIGKLNTGDWLSFGPLVSGKNLILVGKDGSVLLYR